jgi:hypothetical protein
MKIAASDGAQEALVAPESVDLRLRGDDAECDEAIRLFRAA